MNIQLSSCLQRAGIKNVPTSINFIPLTPFLCFFVCLSNSQQCSCLENTGWGQRRETTHPTSHNCADLWSICYEADQGVRVSQGQENPAQGQAASVASEPRTAGARFPLALPNPGGGIVPAVRPGGPGPDVRRGQWSLVLHKHVAGQGSGGGDDSGPEAAGREAESFEPLTSAAAQEGGSEKAAWLSARPRARGWRGPGRRCPRPGLGRGAAPPACAAQRSGGIASILLRPCILITAALIFMSRDSRGTAGCHLLSRPRPPPAPLFLAESWASSPAPPPARQQLALSGARV